MIDSIVGFVDSIVGFVEWLNGILWGPFTIGFIFLTGVFLTVRLRFFPFKRLPAAVKLAWRARKLKADSNSISPWQSLMTAMSATVGTGNIAGVATAIAGGGPGAVFWMWMTAIFGFANKYAECFLAVLYRRKDHKGNNIGGPMYYIQYGMGEKWKWLAMFFAFSAAFMGVTSVAIQSNTIAHSVTTLAEGSAISISVYVIGAVIAVLVALVVIGGFKRIAVVTEKIVPSMIILYVSMCAIVLILNITVLPEMIALIVRSAFTPHAAAGGFAGATVREVIRYGAARGIFSNEAGTGSAPMAHGCSNAKDPVMQGLIGMLGTFIDTILICTGTALIILMAGAWTGEVRGVAMTIHAFDGLFNQLSWVPNGVGTLFVPIALSLFAYTTILGWTFYGSVGIRYLFDNTKLEDSSLMVYRVLIVLMVFGGAVAGLEQVWPFADLANAMLIYPNLIALIYLSGQVAQKAKVWSYENALLLVKN